MANEILVGLKIGATLSGAFHAAFGGARSTVQMLGRTTDGLTSKQKELGDVIRRQMGTLAPSALVALNRDYEKIGRTLDQLKVKQDKLTASISRGEALKARRADIRGQFMETAGTAAAIGAPAVLAVREAMSFQNDLRDIRITAGFDAGEEAELGKMVRGVALEKGQTHSAVNAGIGTLVAGGLGSLDEIRQFVPTMAEVATATGASMEDLGNTTIALRDHMKIAGEDYKAVMNMMAAGGKAGQFELQDMAKWLPNLASVYGGMGQTGKAAVAELTAALQVARMGAGNSDEAANNFKNFLSKLSSPDTIKAFRDAGIDLQDSMRNMAAKGISPVKSMLNIVGTYLGDKGPEAAEKYAKALEIKDDAERETAVRRLDEAYKLGELFRDQQVLAALRPMLANRNKMTAIETESTVAANQDVVATDFALRMDTAGSQMGAFRIGLTELGISVGDALLPALNDILKTVIPVVQQFAGWAAENPGLIKGLVGFAAGLAGVRLGFIALNYGFVMSLSSFNALGTAAASLSAKWTLLRGMLLAGKFAPFISGVRMAGQAVLWFGRALMLNPIGLLITGIAVGAYLIYRYWEPIKGFFSSLWDEIKADFNGGLTGILTLLINFSPLGLFYRAFAGVMSYFGIELPGKFSEFGGMLVTGLVSGISSMAGQAKDAVIGLGDDVTGWFKSRLGIKSPSRVFMAAGANISEGAALGITSQSGLVRKAALGMAEDSQVSMAAPNMAAVSRAATLGDGVGGGMTITFSPTIQMQGGGTVGDHVRQAMTLSFAEFERLMQRYQQGMSRRAYGDIG